MTVDLEALRWCRWCGGSGRDNYFVQTCGWCDGTGNQKPNFHGAANPERHRSCGPVRAWCHDCGEWCYAEGGMLFCGCCLEGFGATHWESP